MAQPFLYILYDTICSRYVVNNAYKINLRHPVPTNLILSTKIQK